jgi:hypothetical protein
MKLILGLLLLLPTIIQASSKAALLGNFKGHTPKGADCRVSISIPGEFEVAISTNRLNKVARFGNIQIEDQLRKRANPLRVERMDGHIYSASTFIAEFTLNSSGVPTAAKVTERVRAMLAEATSTHIECVRLSIE